MINSTKKIINIQRIQESLRLLKKITFYQSYFQQSDLINKQIECEKQSLIYSNKNKQYSNLWIKNCYFFNTLTTGRVKRSSSTENISKQKEKSNLQQQENENKIILKDFENFISELQKLHLSQFESFQKISATIDKYINEKIFAFYSQKPTDSQAVVYFFQNENLFQNYSTALNIKSSVEFRFRKYDEILTNIENELYMFKFLQMQEGLRGNIEKLCNMYVLTLMFNDHQRLRQILRKDYSIREDIEQNLLKEQTKSGGRRISRKSYEGPKQNFSQNLEQDKAESKKGSQSSLFKALRKYMRSLNPSCLLSKAISYSVIGQVQKSFETFCQLLNIDRQNKIFLGNFLSAFIFFGNQNYILDEEKEYSSQNIREFVKKILTKKDVKLTVKDLPKSISPQDAQYLLNSILSFIKDQPLEWTDLLNSQIKEFSHSIYLVAENYYLSGQKQKAIKMIEDLKTKITNKQIKLTSQTQRKGRRTAQKTKTQGQMKSQSNQKSLQSSNIQMLIQFFQLMRLYDQKQYEKIKELESTFQAQQKKTFYQFQSIPNDILRSNIYQIFSQTYRDLKDDEKANQYVQLSVGNHCVNNTYEVNQLEDIEDQIEQNKSTNKQITSKKNRGIPPHYLNLHAQLKDFQVRFI